MESAETKIRYTIFTKVVDVFEQCEETYVSGFGHDAVFQTTIIGWFVSFEGSHESLFFGKGKPALVAGDRVQITIEKF